MLRREDVYKQFLKISFPIFGVKKTYDLNQESETRFPPNVSKE